MKIAATYENGQIFMHFGHTEQFKIYDIDDKNIANSQIVDTDGQGHESLAQFLADKGVEVLICGGIGGGAVSALESAGIEVVSGASGDADTAVKSYLEGELFGEGVNCDHHGEGHTCGEHHSHSCAGHGDDDGYEEEHSCGGCHGCGHRPVITGKNVGKTVSVHYTGTFDNGEVFDSSYDRGEPLTFECGAGMMILGFDKAVANMEIGQTIDIHLLPEEAYGEADPDAIFSIPTESLPGSEELEAGMRIVLTNMYGQQIPVSVISNEDGEITFDANHEMAGKELNFHIELISIEE